jgi:hypothetical protein
MTQRERFYLGFIVFMCVIMGGPLVGLPIGSQLFARFDAASGPGPYSVLPDLGKVFPPDQLATAQVSTVEPYQLDRNVTECWFNGEHARLGMKAERPTLSLLSLSDDAAVLRTTHRSFQEATGGPVPGLGDEAKLSYDSDEVVLVVRQGRLLVTTTYGDSAKKPEDLKAVAVQMARALLPLLPRAGR